MLLFCSCPRMLLTPFFVQLGDDDDDEDPFAEVPSVFRLHLLVRTTDKPPILD